jgi:microcystin-dependent protein
MKLSAGQVPKHKDAGQKRSMACCGLSQTSEAGGGEAHKDMPPYLAIKILIFAGMPLG